MRCLIGQSKGGRRETGSGQALIRPEE
jgi:hypothetical protein